MRSLFKPVVADGFCGVWELESWSFHWRKYWRNKIGSFPDNLNSDAHEEIKQMLREEIVG